MIISIRCINKKILKRINRSNMSEVAMKTETTSLWENSLGVTISTVSYVR